MNRSGFFPGAPDLAIEIVSPSDRLVEVEQKIDEYMTAGAMAVWVINPPRKTVAVHNAGSQSFTLQASERLDGGAVLPGFEVSVAELFD